MAKEVVGFRPGLFTASADLTTKQFHAVKVSGEFTLTFSGAGEKSYGILQNDPDDTEAANAERDGVSKAVAGAAYAAGANLMANAAGRLITATSGNHVVAQALEAATADGDICTVQCSPESLPLA